MIIGRFVGFIYCADRQFDDHCWPVYRELIRNFLVDSDKILWSGWTESDHVYFGAKLIVRAQWIAVDLSLTQIGSVLLPDQIGAFIVFD